jgi:diguanylate cyclase (GGDEF)-like protein
MVLEECTRDLGDEGALHVEGFYQHEDIWWSLSTGSKADDKVAAELDRCSGSAGPYRSTKSKAANFALTELRAVVRAQFQAPLRTATLDAVQRIVLRAYRNASNAFAVSYNAMTGLLAKSSFHQVVEQRLRALASSETSSEQIGAAESTPPGLCLLALDIDHFKQVNDSYGHAYGDLVLRAFAMRFEHAVSAFCKNGSTKLEASCAHVSGEEFFCVAWGDADTQEFEALADSILQAVRDSALPSDAEIERLRSSMPHIDLSIPVLSNRRVSCSIGGVIYGVPTSRESRVSAAKLINQADVALYKSKNQGRDRATFFASILQNGGRVIEHRSDVHICILDIGSDIGVTKGQEFFVFHPQFTGKSPYIFDDGRSRKVLGKLPRVPLCTVTAFDVQRDISFCRISDERFLQTSIPANAVVEAIPLGTLSTATVYSGPIWTADESIMSIASVAETHNRIAGTSDSENDPSIVVVAIRNEGELLSEHGTAAVNRALSAACRHLSKVGEGGFLGQVEATKLLLQLRSFGAQQRTELEASLEKSEKDNGGRAKFMAGVYAGNFGRQKNEPKLPKIADIKVRADLARYAASPEGVLKKARVHIFSHDSAPLVLSRLVGTRAFERGMTDYERFSAIGIVDARLDNWAGLCAYYTNDQPLAETLFLKALDKEPNVLVYRLNLLTSQFHQGNIAAAARTADGIDLAVLETKYREHPYSTACFAIVIAERAATTESVSDLSREVEWAGLALKLEIPERTRSRLSAALALLQQRRRLRTA